MKDNFVSKICRKFLSLAYYILVSILLLSVATFVGYLLGGPVGIGTIICALCAGPVMQFAFYTMHFNAVEIRRQSICGQDCIRRELPYKAI